MMAKAKGFYKDKKGRTRPITERKGKRSRYTGQTKESSWKKSSIKDIKKKSEAYEVEIFHEGKKVKEIYVATDTREQAIKEARAKVANVLAMGGSEESIENYSFKLKGEKTNPEEKWIAPAIKKPGALRATVQRHYGSKGFTEKGTIKVSILNKLSKEKGITGRRARFAKTLRKL